MSSHKRSFQCFSAVGAEGDHRPSHAFKHHSHHLPRIPQHGIVGHHVNECCLCSEYRHAQTFEAVDTHLTPFYHTPYHHPHHHHHHPHQYVLRGPSRPEGAPSGHVHHHRHKKRVVLVKNSDPSLRKTIVLHRRGLRSFGLFLEEVSELMQYHIRKFYTLEGRKIDNVQSLLQCPNVLVCVGREPSHPSIAENFHKTSDEKLPKLNKSHLSGHPDEHGSKEDKII
ncbi:retinitis pigmentosa 1-like 1 protein [Salarias fasciatus]|uniref:retinitis pigmentosa 1-like 1 protein n=1 Tax=Salarias fasciatus TaxID=181472 RepID=UPI0011766E8E|nr:retinitis pigmentosa 1-like 1 protein [Salarias fasciatus]